MDIFTTAWNWIKANILLSIGIGLLVVILFFPKLLRGLFRAPRRRVRHRTIRSVIHRRRVRHAITGTYRRRPSRRRTRTKGAKRPWQVKGSIAARRHMAAIRRMR